MRYKLFVLPCMLFLASLGEKKWTVCWPELTSRCSSLQPDAANSAIRTCRIAQCRQQFAYQHYLLLVIRWVECHSYPSYCWTDSLLWAHNNYKPFQITRTLYLCFGNVRRICCSVSDHRNRPHSHSAYKCCIFYRCRIPLWCNDGV